MPAMERYDAATYGDRIADVYDDRPEVKAQVIGVDLLAELAGSGPVLELGIGTGRVALPLAARGVRVHGIDASRAMVQRMHAKPGGDDIPIAIGDMADLPTPGGPYSLAFVVFNTFFAILTQADQVRCFENVAAALEPGGRFLIEAFVPDLGRFDRGQRTSAMRVAVDEVHLDATVYDPIAQRVDGEHVILRDGEPVRMLPVSLRFAWPSELDLMARLAGMELEVRYGGWAKEPFAPECEKHVSVYRVPQG
jgi:SAM-dependent methyltransferase